MFLKRIEMQGFKSFADRIVINFDNNITGVVGPNGCGKSNISDAIRWVLGEQSVKSLRGEKMSDIIFSGSANRRAQSMAEVTLVFDNSKKQLNNGANEIEITRKIYSNDQEAEYLINRNRVRLKDITDLILDSGLGKDSLCLISQGNINTFAEAKPIERRGLFEDAAGVGKYKKRKIESLNRLERTKENLDRAFDIINELERQVNPLKRQAIKAEKYNKLKQRLQEIEIAVLVEDIKKYSSVKNEIEKELFDLETKITTNEATILIHENNINDAKDKLKHHDYQINKLQDELMKIINEIQILEKRKVEIDEKRKYEMEVGNDSTKISHLESMLNEAKFEYEDRLKRIEKIKVELELLTDDLIKTNDDNTEITSKKEEVLNTVRRLENRRELLQNLIKDPFNSQSLNGVKSIMENKNSLFGIMGVVGQEISALNNYEEALKSSLANAAYHIITNNENAARNAINFLKKNRSGRATFLPLTVLKPHYLSENHEVIAKSVKGYLGLMSDFVENEEIYDDVVDSLLANVLVCDNLENANILGNLLSNQYKIVTLDGDIINKGGSMTGGKVKNETSIVTATAELKRIDEELEILNAKKELIIKDYNNNYNKKNDIENKITEHRIAYATLEPILEVKRAKYEKIVSELEIIKPNNSNNNDDNFSDKIIIDLNEYYSRRDEVTLNIKTSRELRMRLNNEIERKEQQVRQIRKELNDDQNKERNIYSSKAQTEIKLETSLERLASEYQMTYEYAANNISIELMDNAKDEVNKLRSDIEALGNINMNAQEEYAEINQRYEFIKKNYDDLVSSRDRILKAIDEMDQIMKHQFKETFDKINNELNNTFQVLFGGGKAKLVLEDPDDILNTGIDIDVQPPGKSVKSIRLFSGGEKTLIAICVLFTILKVKPVPLVVFDEVEAALDQANVERFAKYVNDFSEDTQFIIITHRPGTMAECDVLYGVTMQHQGVSQMLKVKLVDAVELGDKTKMENN
ncbi:MAG: AAA family ATPase [Erysipelotrichaceae bacterium]|nr:AAA family ATPase [Erysipelotrichaceae bacterium]